MTAALVREVHLPREQELLLLEQRVLDVMAAWARDWLPAADLWTPQVSVSMEPAAETSDVPWRAFSKGGGLKAQAWASDSDRTKARLAALLVERESTDPLPPSDWAVSAALAALDELNVRLLGSPLSADQAQPDLRAWSGVLLVREESLSLCWAFAPEAYAGDRPTVPAAPAAIQPLTLGLSRQKVQLSVGLGDVEIAVADLMALQTGDVIRFPALLKGSVPVSIELQGEETQIAQAQLGQQGGRVAVRLLSKQTVA